MPQGEELRDRIKRGVKRTLRRRVSGSDAHRAAVLTYHSVGARHHAMNVSPATFAAHAAWLAAHVPVISLDQLLEGAPGFALTFDDGYADNLYQAAPVLAAHGLPATVFMVAGRFGGTLADEREVDAGRLLSEEELRRLATEYGWTVGAHTLSHPYLSRLPVAEQTREIGESRMVLERVLGRPVEFFAYPYGSVFDYTAETVAAAAAAGYRAAFTNRYGVFRASDGPYTYRRIWIDSTDTVELLAAKVSGELDRLRWFETRAAMHARRAYSAWQDRR